MNENVFRYGLKTAIENAEEYKTLPANSVNIGHYGSGAQTQFRIETSAGTQTVWKGGRLVNSAGAEITSQTINPNTSPTHTAVVYVKFAKAVTDYNPAQQVYQGTFPIQISHDGGRSFTTIKDLLIVISK